MGGEKKEKKAASKPKATNDRKMVGIMMTAEEHGILGKLVASERQKTGYKVSKTAVITKLIREAVAK